MAIATDDSYYILRFDRDAYNTRLEEGALITDEGVEEAFEVVAEVSERFVDSLTPDGLTDSNLSTA